MQQVIERLGANFDIKKSHKRVNAALGTLSRHPLVYRYTDFLTETLRHHPTVYIRPNERTGNYSVGVNIELPSLADVKRDPLLYAPVLSNAAYRVEHEVEAFAAWLLGNDAPIPNAITTA